MNVRVFRQKDQTSAPWAGGVTTQLGIWPDGAGYARGDFGWRLSSAQVVAGESQFTELRGVMRHLMCLEGSMEIIHNEGEPAHLTPFLAYRFDGGISTVSHCDMPITDFNLMTRGACKGKIQAVNKNIRTILLKPRSELHFQCLYTLCEKIKISVGHPSEQPLYEEVLFRGDFMQIAYDHEPLAVGMSGACDVGEHGITVISAGISCAGFAEA